MGCYFVWYCECSGVRDAALMSGAIRTLLFRAKEVIVTLFTGNVMESSDVIMEDTTATMEGS